MLGTRKNIKNDCSQHWEAPKMRKTRVPNFGNTCFVSFTGHHAENIKADAPILNLFYYICSRILTFNKLYDGVYSETNCPVYSR